MDKELYRHINNLLSFMRSTDVVGLVNKYYKDYGNDAPGFIIQDEMNELQKRLDDHRQLGL